jgi:DNA-binding response OmpR family regulator
MKNLAADWSQTEFLVDYLLHSSALRDLLPLDPTWQATTLTTSRSNTLLRAESQQFLTQIGAPTPTTQHFSLRNSNIYYGDNPLSTLTSRENIIMSKLIEKSPSPATVDELADLLFPNSDKFSLAALTKCVERLRDKLETLGIPRHVIATASGVGYYLNN